MKKQFTAEELAISIQILGSKSRNRKLGLSSYRTEHLISILAEEIKLLPVMIRYGDTFKLFNAEEFDKAQIDTKPDGFCSILYTPQDCEIATGSNAGNWRQWSAQLFGYKRESHPFAPIFRPPDEVLKVLEKRGQLGKRRKTPRFLTLEAVVFYIAVQTRTWGNPNRILDLKQRLNKLDITTIRNKIQMQDPIDIDDLFDEDEKTTPPPMAPPKTRVPKSGQRLVGYNPLQTALQAATPYERTLLQKMKDKASGMAAHPANVKATVNDPVAPAPTDPSTMTDDELALKIQTLQALLKEQSARKLRKQFEAEAQQGIPLGGKVWPDRGEWATLTMKFPNGNTVIYYHQQLMEQKVSAEADCVVLSTED